MRIPALCLVLLALAGSAQALTIERDTRWSGERRIAEKVTVPSGVTLTLLPGTVVRFAAAGSLEVTGRLTGENARLVGEQWGGVTLKGCDAGTRLTAVEVSGARTGVLVQGGNPLLERLTLRDNEVGIELRGKSAATVRDGLFSANRKVGLFIKDDSPVVATGNRFEANVKYGAYIYRATPAQFARNRFERNPTGLMIAYFGSDPVVADNHFTDNEVGIEVDRAARPLLRGNRLEGNRTGLLLQRRADPQVTGNRFAGNREAIRLAYSSYPRIVGNDFAGNDLAIRLEFQSSTWEREQGASTRAGEVAAAGAFGSGQGARTVSEEQRRPAALDGTIDARDNWWGEPGNLELARSGDAGNPSFIHDGRDQPTFIEAGKSYPLDRVLFAPWSTAPHLGEVTK